MCQPPGFVDPDKPNHVCKLRKAIYGLKQAPRAWYVELRNYLLSAGFVNSQSDASLFIYRRNNDWVYLLVYVDDMLVTGTNQALVNQIIHGLGTCFSIKDLGHLSYFFGIEATRTSRGLHLMQRKYILDLLLRTKMSDAKTVATPLPSSPKLSLHSGTTLLDRSL